MQTSVNPRHGPHRRPVGGVGTTVSSETPGRWARSAVARYARGAQRGLLGFTHGRSLARSASSLSSLADRSSPFPAVAALRTAQRIAAETGGGSARPWPPGFERSIYRCELQFGEKRGAAVGPTRRGKGSKIMAIADRHGLPVACSVASASPHETKLVEATVEQRFTRAKPARMIGDRAYDSDPLDQRLRQKHHIRLIAPHRYIRRRKSTQDGRELRRYCRRWRIERLFAWLHNFRRLVSRWEYHEANFLGMLQLGCLVILLRHL